MIQQTNARTQDQIIYILKFASRFLLKFSLIFQVAKDNYARRETFGRIPRTIPVSHAETLRRSEAKGHGDSSFW